MTQERRETEAPDTAGLPRTQEGGIEAEPAALPEGATDVPSEAWAEWAARTSREVAGRSVSLRYSDVALGEVQLAEGEPLVSIDHEELGGIVAMTIRYGDGVVPRRHVVAEPQRVLEEHDEAGQAVRFVIVDRTRRMTWIGLG